MIRPSVGRVVHYRPDGMDGVTLSGTIAKVVNEGLLNLSVLDENGDQTPKTSIRLRQPEDNNRTPPYAEWPSAVAERENGKAPQINPFETEEQRLERQRRENERAAFNEGLEKRTPQDLAAAGQPTGQQPAEQDPAQAAVREAIGVPADAVVTQGGGVRAPDPAQVGAAVENPLKNTTAAAKVLPSTSLPPAPPVPPGKVS